MKMRLILAGATLTMVVALAWLVRAQQYGPVGWWPLDEGPGTNTADASGNGNDGALTNGPTWVTGIFSNALSFDGINDQYVQAQPTGTVNGTFTVAAWALPLDPGESMVTAAMRIQHHEL